MKRRDFILSGMASAGCFVCTNRLAQAAGIIMMPDGTGLWKWSREAYHYKLNARGVLCTNCPNACSLQRSETGKCRNRINVKDKLYSIAYGNPCAVHIDPIEKKPFFHFLPSTQAFSIATAGCNFACLNCQNWEISQKSPKETQNSDLMPAAVVEACQKNACRSIAYTYSEPTVFYEYVYDTAKLARAAGIKNIYKSNGYINEQPLRMLCKYLDAANIDLKGFSESIYLKLNSGKLAPVLRTLQVLKDEGVWLEITNLVIPSWTDDLKTIAEMCKWLVNNKMDETPLHFSRFTPLYKLQQLPATPALTLKKARDTALQAGMKYVYIGNLPGSESENTICPKCSKTVIERKGFRVLKNNVVQGKCSFCGQKIAGVFSG
jgi:pyruvate formate lyase activating enzyme